VDGVDRSATGAGGAPAQAGRVLVATFDGKGVIMRREALRTAERPDPGTVGLGAGLPGHQQSGCRRGRKRLDRIGRAARYSLLWEPFSVRPSSEPRGHFSMHVALQ
jgi:hypothetical protein